MKKCKFCLAEIEDSETRCPCCGKDMEEMAEEIVVEEVPAEEVPVEEVRVEETAVEETPAEAPKKKATPGKIALAVAAIVVLVAILVSLIFVGMNTVKDTEVTEEVAVETVEETVPATVPADGEPGTATEKGTYTASDEEVMANADTVIATMGDKALTNGQFQVYYWMGYHNFMTTNYAYAQYFGLDSTKPLDTQIMNPALHGQDASMTWQQYFLQFALDSWQQVQAMAVASQEAGFDIVEEDQRTLENLETDLTEAIKAYNVSLEDYMAMNFGHGADLEDYRHYQQVYFQGAPYYAQQIQKMQPTDQDLEKYFDDHADEYASGGITKESQTVDVRHILLTPENAKEDGTYAEEDWAACEEKANALLAEYQAGDRTEAAFAALANANSTDPGSNTNGGLYEDVYEGQMVPTFNDWCFDAARWSGETGLVKTDYGYHIMYFVKANKEVWKDYASSDWINEKSNAMVETLIAEHPIEVSYDKINIGQLMAQGE